MKRTEKWGGARPAHGSMAGFSLLEVMIALVIIAIGLLGIAKMQALALSNTGASRSRALAAIEASSLAGAMHANRAYWASANSVPGTVTITTSAGAASIPSSTSAAMGTALTAAWAVTCPMTQATGTMTAVLSCFCTTGNAAPCAPAYINMAASDLADWARGLGSALPTSTATVSCNNLDAPVDCTINITWQENVVALTPQESAAAKTAGPAAFQNVTYTLYVVP